MSKRNLNFINYAYAIGAILVVLGHSTPTGSSDMPLFIDNIRTFIYCFHMPLFFFIAGVLLRYTTKFKKKPYGMFIKNKVKRFLIPYFVFSAVGFFPKIFLSSLVNDEVSFSFKYLVTIVFNPRQNVWGHFWFLPTLLIIYVFSYLLLRCIENKYVKFAVTVIVILMAVLPIKCDWFAINDIFKQLVYFWIGLILSDTIIDKRNKIFKCWISIMCIILSVIAFVYFKNHYYYGKEWLSNLVSVIIGVLMIYAVMYISELLEIKNINVLDFLNGKTFTVYLFSWPCQAIVEMLTNRVLGLHWYVVMPSMFIVGMVIPLLISFVYSKFKKHPSFINLLIGYNE